nr:hypothetical protein [uncultured Mediterranean phage uvMED]|tara:strand:+ start:3931 stop:4095 length:165 start_codon:yes stop_codon:yes gene_type:complete
MNPDEIKLEKLSKNFEYEKLSRDIDSIDDIKVLRDVTKSYIKLYLKQQETLKII